ncbi:hypothetical protein B0H12DRAFT_1147176 [Mycena haematopus]|nr:hypothetical protein B0H12DRAFT_1147176 [Mycena haematopus]
MTTPEALVTSDDSSDLEPDPSLPPGWEKFVHLNGGIYYTHDRYRLLTTDDICVQATRDRVLGVYTSAHAAACFRSATRYDPAHPRPRIVDLEMSVAHVGGVPQIGFASWSRCQCYYYANNKLIRKNRSVFWEHAGKYPMHRKRHIRLMETQFLSALAFGANERILEIKATTFPFEDAQIERLIRIYVDLRGPVDSKPEALVPALSYHIARVMVPIEAARERYGYGTRDARIYRDIAIPPPTWKVRIWDFFLGIILCGTHKNYRVRLEATIPKGVVALPEFRLLMGTLMSEWADSNLVATVLVSVTVGFLAVPNTSLQRSSAIVSSLCAMTSIVTGLHHVWQHRGKTDIESSDARQYLYFSQLRPKASPDPLDAQTQTPDLTLTACLLALPLATLQWSVLSFMLTIVAYAFQSTSTAEGRILLAVLLVVLGVAAAAVFLFFWRIWAAPLHKEMEEGFNPNLAQEPDLPWVARWVNRLQGRKWGVSDVEKFPAADNGEFPLVVLPSPPPIPPTIPIPIPATVPVDPANEQVTILSPPAVFLPPSLDSGDAGGVHNPHIVFGNTQSSLVVAPSLPPAIPTSIPGTVPDNLANEQVIALPAPVFVPPLSPDNGDAGGVQRPLIVFGPSPPPLSVGGRRSTGGRKSTAQPTGKRRRK